MGMLNIVVVGTGMYATGRGTSGFGTILPSICEWERLEKNIGKVVFVGTDGKKSGQVEKKCRDIFKDSGVDFNVEVFPKDGVVDPECYKSIIQNIEKPACAIVAVPDHLHHDVVKNVIEASLPVLVVKPLAPTVSEVESLIQLASNKDIYAAIEFHKRWDKANLLIKDFIQQKRIGDLLYIWTEYSQRKSIPTSFFKEWSSHSSILQYLGIHYIDIVYFYTGATPKRVMAIGQKKWLVEHGVDTWDSIQCVIEWKDKDGSEFIQTILTNWIDPEETSSMSDQKIKVVGTKGRYESDQKDRGQKVVVDNDGIEDINPDFCMTYGSNTGEKRWRGYGIDSITTYLNDVLDIYCERSSIQDLGEIRPVFSDGLISTAVVEAAHQSLKENNTWKVIEVF